MSLDRASFIKMLYFHNSNYLKTDLPTYLILTALQTYDVFLIIFRLCYVGHVHLAGADLWYQLRLLWVRGSSDPYFDSVSVLD